MFGIVLKKERQHITGGNIMKNNNQVIIERDMFCPYCGGNSAVLIVETVKTKKVFGCAPIGLKDGCLLCLTGGCWMLICGLPLCDVKSETVSHLYGFCPCCGNSYPVNKPEFKAPTISEKFNNMKEKTTQMFDMAKNKFSRNNDDSTGE